MTGKENYSLRRTSVCQNFWFVEVSGCFRRMCCFC